MASSLRDLHPAKLDPNIQMLIGGMLARNSSKDVHLGLGHIIYEIHHSSELHIHVCSPELDGVLQTVVIEGVSSLSDVSVSSLPEETIILVKVIDNLVLYHGHRNGFIAEITRIPMPTAHSILSISKVQITRQTHSWVCITEKGLILYVEYLERTKKMQFHELNPQKGINSFIRGFLKPLLPPQHRLSHGEAYLWGYAQKNNLYAFVLKDLTLQARFARLPDFPNVSDTLIWSANFGQVLSISMGTVLHSQFFTDQERPFLHLLLAINVQNTLQMFHFMFDISNGTREIKAKATFSLPQFMEITLDNESLYLLMQKDQEWRVSLLDVNSLNEVKSWEWSRAKGTFRLMMINGRALLVSEGSGYFLGGQMNNSVDNLNQSCIRDQSRKKKYQKLLNWGDWNRIASQLRIDLQNESKSSQQYYLISFILEYLQRTSVKQFIQASQQPEQLCQSLIIDVSIAAVQELISILTMKKQIKPLTNAFKSVLSTPPPPELAQFLFETLHVPLAKLLEQTFSLPQNFGFEQNELMNLFMRLHFWVGRVEEIDEDIIQKFLREDRKGWRDLHDGVKVIMSIAMDIGCVRVMKLLFIEGLIQPEDVLEFLSYMRTNHSELLNETVKEFIHLQIKKGESLRLLGLMPEIFHTLLEQFLLQAYPKVGIYFLIQKKKRQKIANYLINNEYVLIQFMSPDAANNVLEALQEYDQEIEGRKCIASNKVLAMMMSELGQRFVSVESLKNIQDCGKKLDVKITKQIWDKYQKKIQQTVGIVIYEKIVNALILPQ